MIAIVFKLLISTVAVYATAAILPGIAIKNFVSAIGVAIILALLNTFLKPVLVFLSFPITVLTLGLFLLIIDTLIVLIAGKLLSGFKVDGFWWALLFGIIMSLISSALNWMFEM